MGESVGIMMVRAENTFTVLPPQLLSHLDSPLPIPLKLVILMVIVVRVLVPPFVGKRKI